MNNLPNNKVSITAQVFTAKEEVTPLNLFSQLAHLPWAIWLDSCQSEHINSRYDILVWQPQVTLTTKGSSTRIEWLAADNNKTQVIKTLDSTDDPLSLIKSSQEALFKDYDLPQTDLPFKGGALGYFAYDLGRRFEHFPTKAVQDIDLADMAIGIYHQAIIFDHHTEQCFLLCPEHLRKTITLWLHQQLANKATKTEFQLTSSWQSNLSKNDYDAKFTKIQDYLLAGDCYQINLSQRFSAPFKGDEFIAYQALRASNSAPFSAFMRFEHAAVLSISPERFLQLKNGRIQSKPIKGTRARGKNIQEDQDNASILYHSTKDRAENVMIVDLLRNDISKVCQSGSVQVPELFTIESFPAVHHLVSTVEGTLATEFDGSDLLRAAFPGGSITGAPKIRAMEIIEELEPQRRSVYCGSIGYISACGNMDTNIAIRTLICENQQIHCWAGGGIVADSENNSEYQETFDKVQRILPVLSQL